MIIENHYQKIAYEGFNLLCESCGRFRHTLRNCPKVTPTVETRITNNNGKTKEIDSLTKEIDQWAIVTHKKKSKKL